MSDLPELTERLRMPPIFPTTAITGEMLEKFHAALAEQGVKPNQYYIEALVIYDASVKDEITKASYAVI